MRLEAARFPDPLHGPERDAHDLGHRASGPVRRLTGWFRAGDRQDLGNSARRERSFAGRARLIPPQTFHSGFRKALPPAPDRRAAHVGLAGYLLNREVFGRVEDNVRPLDVLERAVAVADDRGQALTIARRQDHTGGLSHARRLAGLCQAVNPQNPSMH
jgi:hypothetical protein